MYIFQFIFLLIYFILFFNADQTGFLSTMIRNLHYSLLLDFFPMSGFSSLMDSDLCDMFRIMLPGLAMTAYSPQSDSCKLFIGCFKNHRLFICINGILIHKSLSTSLVRIFFFFWFRRISIYALSITTLSQHFPFKWREKFLILIISLLVICLSPNIFCTSSSSKCKRCAQIC